MNAPGVAIAIRKALTKGLREAFNVTEAKFAEVDKLMLQLRTSEGGKALVATWNTARVAKGSGGGSSQPPTGPTPPTPPKP